MGGKAGKRVANQPSVVIFLIPQKTSELFSAFSAPKFGGFVFSSYLCSVKPILFTLNRMLMKQKKTKFCEKSGQKFGSVEHFIYFCRWQDHHLHLLIRHLDLSIDSRISINKQEKERELIMGVYIGFVVIAVPCILFLLYCLTPRGKRWLKVNGLL